METALALSGGGAKGAFQAGAISELVRQGIRFQNVAGVSVGALNGVMVAANRINRMVDIWQTITEDDVLKKRSVLNLLSKLGWYKLGLGAPPKSIYSNAPLFNLLEKEFRDIELNIPLVIGRVDLRTGKYINAISPELSDFSKEVLASTAIPVIWKPVEIEGGLFVDGGVRNMTPLKDAIQYQPDRIVVIINRPLSSHIEDTSIRSIIDIAERSLDIVLDEIFIEDLKRCMQINGLVQQAEQKNITLKSKSGEPLKYYELMIVEPPEPLGNTLDFSRDQLDRLLQMGREAARKAVNNG